MKFKFFLFFIFIIAQMVSASENIRLFNTDEINSASFNDVVIHSDNLEKHKNSLGVVQSLNMSGVSYERLIRFEGEIYFQYLLGGSYPLIDDKNKLESLKAYEAFASIENQKKFRIGYSQKFSYSESSKNRILLAVGMDITDTTYKVDYYTKICSFYCGFDPSSKSSLVKKNRSTAISFETAYVWRDLLVSTYLIDVKLFADKELYSFQKQIVFDLPDQSQFSPTTNDGRIGVESSIRF